MHWWCRLRGSRYDRTGGVGRGGVGMIALVVELAEEKAI